MLEYLRNAAEKPVAKVLIAILAFSFVGWGVAEWVFGGAARDTTLVKVGSQEITIQQFNVERSRELARLTRDQQKQIYTDPEYANSLFSNVLTTLTNNRLVENRAEDLGFVVTDKRIAREIREFPEFQQNGRFSTVLFDAVLNNSGFTEETLSEFLRGQILRSMVLGSVSMPITVPNFALQAAYNARYSQKQIDYAVVNFSDFKVGTPTDAQLQEFYAKSPKIIPEFRKVSYVLIPAKMDKPDSYDASYKTAQKVEDAIISGDTMAATATKHKANYVALPAFAADKRPADSLLTDAMIAKIFAMEQGLESELMETKNGFVILRVDEIIPTHNAEFNTVKKDLVAGWKKEEQKKQAYLKANNLLVDFNQGKDLRGKKTATVSRMTGAPTDVLIAAFSQNIGTNAIVPGAGAFYVLRVEKEIAPKMDTAKMAGLRKELQNMTTREIMDDYNSFLMREYPVKVNKKTFEKLFTK